MLLKGKKSGRKLKGVIELAIWFFFCECILPISAEFGAGLQHGFDGQGSSEGQPVGPPESRKTVSSLYPNLLNRE